ncbi:hypothetical protein Ade02nite_67760 [Paractinoplanes deccanensis]|uniref:Uncharacterized protein n=1 Tax=Paractinoplanes deccanensis TaxID=113561 RepID=A0ABQ3YEC3_9ACTN|nr:hypothetical protein Ade02nite_67760 [Actinoplanes deccanensis]
MCSSHNSGAAARIEKYMANNAAKNMSSLESHTIVPTLTMFGRVSEWILLLSMAEAAVTRLIIAPRSVQGVAGGGIRHEIPARKNGHRPDGPSLEWCT